MIRPVLEHELAALHALIEAAYRGDTARRGWTHEADLLGGQRTDLDSLHAAFVDPYQQILVAVSGDQLIGTISVIDKGADGSGLSMLAVHPDHQTSGLGRRLLTAAETCARTRFAALTMRMTVIDRRHELIDYYIRRGYRPTGACEPFPYGDDRFGLPVSTDLKFVVLAKSLAV